MVSLSRRWLDHLSANRLDCPASERPSSFVATSEQPDSQTQGNVPEPSVWDVGTLPCDVGFEELYRHLDPLGYSLNCANAVVSISTNVLAEIEDLLGVPPRKGVHGGRAPVSTNISYRRAERCKSADPHQLHRNTPTEHFATSLPSRFVALLWEDDGGAVLAKFAWCRAKLSELAANRYRPL
jgi:hypothetical protein